MTVEAVVRDNQEESRFEIATPSGLAVLHYHLSGRRLNLDHTETPRPDRGLGIASRLVEAALRQARALGLEVVPNCPFVRAYIERHPEHQDLVAP